MVQVPVHRTRGSTRNSVQDLNPEAQAIVSQALSVKSRSVYLNYWKHYVQFCREQNINISLPIRQVVTVNFLSYLLVSKKYSLSTVTSHVSALAYINKLFDYEDFSSSFLVRQFLKGAQKITPTKPDTRLPITIELLKKIIMALPVTIKTFYDRIMFSSMCLLAFHGFLRVGEICTKSQHVLGNVIQCQHVKMVNESQQNAGIEIFLEHFKHSTRPVTLYIPLNLTEPDLCAVLAWRRYCQLKKHSVGPLFQFPDGTSVTYKFFSMHLNNVITYLGYDAQLFKSHSFRIGAATHATSCGFSEDSIRRMGRWKSNAVSNYVRLPNVGLQADAKIKK